MDEIINDSVSFNTLKLVTIDIENLLNNINTKNDYIKKIYQKYIHNNHLTDDSKISLDILNYQTELIENENENNTKMYKNFINHMYGHYYKLHNKYISYINEISNEHDLLIKCKNFTAFVDLDDTIKFNIDDCENIFNAIRDYNVLVHGLIKVKNQEILNDNQTKNSGIFLNNYINIKTHDVNLIEEKINYFIGELFNFFNFHYNFINRMKYKLSLELKYIDNKINSNILYNNNHNKFRKLIKKYNENLIKYQNENENKNENKNKSFIKKNFLIINYPGFYKSLCITLLSFIFYKFNFN